MKLTIAAVLVILALIRWAAAAHVTMTAGSAQVTMPVLALVVTLAVCLMLAAFAFMGGLILQEARS